MDKIDELIEMVDQELGFNEPGTDKWKDLIHNREYFIKQKYMLKQQSQKKRPSPDKILECITKLAQVAAIAIIGYAVRPDREALRFIDKF